MKLIADSRRQTTDNSRKAADGRRKTVADVAIIGAGIIGLSLGWKLLKHGIKVTIYDQGEAGRGATWASAGMMGPDAEIGFEELDVYRFGIASMKRWPGFVEELEADSGMEVDYRTEGTLLVADDRDGAALLRRIYAFQQEQGVDVEWISTADALALEPMLTPRLSAAILSSGDHQVDPRKLVLALRKAFLSTGGALHEQTRVEAVDTSGSHPVCVLDGGERFETSLVIVAAGAWTNGIKGIPSDLVPIRPVKGQMIELAMEAGFTLDHVLRGPAYIAPKRNGRLLIGATQEEMGYNTDVTAGGVYYLLERAWRLLPGIYELPLTDTWAGLRPATPDHAAVVGFAEPEGLFYATGHFRHGILEAPVTSELAADWIATGERDPLLDVCDPYRFTEHEPVES